MLLGSKPLAAAAAFGLLLGWLLGCTFGAITAPFAAALAFLAVTGWLALVLPTAAAALAFVWLARPWGVSCSCTHCRHTATPDMSFIHAAP